VIATGTASGKTLGYNLPVLDRLLRDPEARALYIFPTKALAQDQLAALHELLPRSEGPSAAIYDGDTPQRARRGIRNQAQLVLTNPDMLHVGILPHHTNWPDFFQRLQFIVIDELHTYRGVFGSHVANVLRRLGRVARFYGMEPQFCLTSATIANPVELARGLIEAPVELIDRDGSARGGKSFLIYNPPVIDQHLGIRISALQESVRLAEDLLAKDVQTIIFGRSRRAVELALTYLRQSAGVFMDGSQPEQSIRGYRSGYLPRQRREIERDLRQGKVRTVIATNALELGIDIGGLDAVLLVGYPGSIAATWQQAGRAGRGESTALAVLVASAAPLDQFLAANPDYFFQRSPENALINPDNLLILLDHLRCAAFELPFEKGERFGGVDAGLMDEFLQLLQAEGVLHHSGDKFFWMADQYPAHHISLRSASPQTVNLQSWVDGQAITVGQVDGASANWLVHPEAIYMHEGRIYIVEELDLEAGIAYLEHIAPDYYTVPRRDTTVELIELFEQQAVSGGQKSHGEVQVTSQLTGYRKVRWHTHETLGFGEISLPPTELLTTGYWLDLDEASVENLRESGLWRNDPNKYGPNWDRQRHLARERDNYQCQVCGVPEDERAHDVHHKIPFRQFTSYELANQLDNLVTLCPTCHRRAESAVRVRSGLAGLSFVLGHLAPLFLMCDSGDLGVASDPKLALSEGRPGVVIYDQVPAGIGFSQRLFELHDKLITQAQALVSACECHDGCPSCVGPGGELGTGGKRETLAILKALTA
jgi:DEAD/DEAH box helicase domain-containing protein